jgi:RimJ/RimL family protein N-acetyltransferase
VNAILETERLLLREFVPADVDEFALVICDRDNMRFYPEPFERPDVEAWIDRNLRRYRQDGIGLWAMILKSEGRLVGDCGLVYQNVNGTTEVEVGYHLNRAYQGRGLATEAARACRDYAFQRLGLQRVISLIRPENLPSRRVAERNGMQVEGETLCMGLPHLIYVATASKSGA